MKKTITLAAVTVTLVSQTNAATTLISPTLNNGGFETTLGGTVVSGNSSGDGNTNAGNDRFAANNGTISVPGWTIAAGGFSGIDGSQVNDFTAPAPANGQDSSPNKGRGGSRRTLLINNSVETTATSDSVTVGLTGDIFNLSFWTAGNRTDDNHFEVQASILFDAGLGTEIAVNFNLITHTELDAANGTLADNLTTGFIERNTGALGDIVAPIDYTTAQLVLDVDNNGTDGANENDQVYVDDVTLTVETIPEPSVSMFGLLALTGLLRRRR